MTFLLEELELALDTFGVSGHPLGVTWMIVTPAADGGEA
jgi:hypothetical protein